MPRKPKGYVTRKSLEARGRKMGLTGLKNLDYPELRAVVRNTYARRKKEGTL